jgi:hypothetical protein
MRDREAGSSYTSNVLRDLLDEIEALRIARQQEVRDRPHPRLKRFSQQEFTDEACPTYKNLLLGRSHRVPSRETIMQMADYLECSAAERNTFLVAARYLPEPLALEGAALREALQQAHPILATLPYPAMLLTHRLQVQAINDAFERVFAFPSLQTIPPEQRSLFHFVFHPGLLLRGRGTLNNQTAEAWQAHASYCIRLFQRSNVLSQFEPWYREMVELLSTLADFRTFWQRAQATPDQPPASSKTLLARDATTDQLFPIQFQPLHIAVCSHLYPCVMAFVPLDEAARVACAFPARAEGSGSNVGGMLL